MCTTFRGAKRVRKTLSPDGAASARDPTAPSALADPGLVLVRGPDRPDLQDEGKGWIMRVKLTEAQLVMMRAGAQRKDRCLSAPATIKGAALSKVGVKLTKLGLVREIEAKARAPIWRCHDAGHGYALKLTAAGLKAIAVDEGSQDLIEPSEAPQPQAKNAAGPDQDGLPARVTVPRAGTVSNSNSGSGILRPETFAVRVHLTNSRRNEHAHCLWRCQGLAGLIVTVATSPRSALPRSPETDMVSDNS